MAEISLLETGRVISKIFHISDVHIRLFTRHDEYRTIFQKLYSHLRSYENELCVRVITGDICHSKNDLSPELELLTFDFFKALSEIMPCFVIAGNHDGKFFFPQTIWYFL